MVSDKTAGKHILLGLTLSYPVLLPLPTGLQVLCALLSVRCYLVAYKNLR